MDALHLTHLVVLALWGGLVLGECVLELAAKDEAAMRHTARVHYWTDVVVELPLLIAVIVTGAWLTVRAWPLSALLGIKILAGLGAVTMNLVCLVFVSRRHARADDPRALSHYHARIRQTVALGVACGGLAAYLGFAHFMG